MKYSSVIFLLFISMLMSGCVSIAEYQKMYVGDKDMVQTNRSIEQFELNIHQYREAASGANGGKTGGGCGCN